MTVRRRTFTEVLDNLLTALAGGVAAEAHPFPPPGADAPPFLHRLEQPPAREIVAVHGRRNGQTHRFRPGADYAPADGGTALAWAEGAELPDPGTLVDVTYTTGRAGSGVTDFSTGSVVRTLAESTALEIARLYAQLDAVYRSAFIDTATGDSLENVVALLGLERIGGEHPAGEVEFTRAAGGRGEITIPTGTLVMTADGGVEYETTATVTLADRQDTIRVAARDLEPNEPLGAGTLVVLPIPIQGIASVTNPAPTQLPSRDETDEELRVRAKSFLHGSERATLGALRGAMAREQVDADVVDFADRPGYVEITPHVDAVSPELELRLRAAIAAARPAGVRVDLMSFRAPQRVDLALRLTTASSLLEADLSAAQAEARRAVELYFDRLDASADGSVNQLVGALLAVPGVQDVRLLSATVGAVDVLDRAAGTLTLAGTATELGELRIADPNLPTLVAATLTHFAAGQPPDPAVAQAGLTQALAAASAANEAEGAAVSLTFEQLRAATGAAADVAVEFAVSARDGASTLMRAPAGPPYVLTPFERLALSAVVVRPQAEE